MGRIREYRPPQELPEKIVEQCSGCNRIRDDETCNVYLYPNKQWGRLGGCAMATHIKRVVKEKVDFVDPLKASKRKAKGK